MNISNLTIVELKALVDAIPKELKRRESAEKNRIRKEIEALAAQAGFSLDDLLAQAESKVKMRKPVAVKYAHPQNSSLTWTGRGRQPRWIVQFLSSGGTLEQLSV